MAGWPMSHEFLSWLCVFQYSFHFSVLFCTLHRTCGWHSFLQPLLVAVTPATDEQSTCFISRCHLVTSSWSFCQLSGKRPQSELLSEFLNHNFCDWILLSPLVLRLPSDLLVSFFVKPYLLSAFKTKPIQKLTILVLGQKNYRSLTHSQSFIMWDNVT